MKRDGPKIGTLAILTLALREDTAQPALVTVLSAAEHRPGAVRSTDPQPKSAKAWRAAVRQTARTRPERLL